MPNEMYVPVGRPYSPGGNPCSYKPCGDPAIVRSHFGTERVGGDVEPTAVEIKADLRGDSLAELALGRGRVMSFEDSHVGAAAASANCCYERHKLIAKRR